MAAVKTAADPKRRADFLDSMEEEMRRVSEHLERRERRLGLKGRRSGEIMNGYSFSEGSGAEAGARRRRINHYPRQLRHSEDSSSSGSPDTRSPSPAWPGLGRRSAPPAPSLLYEQLPANTRTGEPETASPAARERWGSRGSQHDDPELMKLKKSATGSRSYRAASSSPLHKLKSPPPPVAPKPKSRRSPGPPSPRLRAASAPPSQRPGSRREVSKVTLNERKESCEPAETSQVSASPPAVEETPVMEDMMESLESEPTPVPLPDHTPSPTLTPEPSEPLVIHQQQWEQSRAPDTLFPAPLTSLEVKETQGRDSTASPGIIEISGSFSFDKRRTADRRVERSVSPIAEETEAREKEGGMVIDVVEPPDVESALLEAMMEGGGEGEGEEWEGMEGQRQVEEMEADRDQNGEVEVRGEGERVAGEDIGGEGEEEGEGEQVREVEVGGEGEREIEEREQCTDPAEDGFGPEECKEGGSDLVEEGWELAPSETHMTLTSDIPQPSPDTELQTGPVTDHLTSDLRRSPLDLTSDPQEPEIKSLPLMFPAAGRRGGTSPGQRSRRSHDEVSLMVQDLQLQLREKEEELGRQRRAAERDAREREELVSRLTRESQKLERERWELLKRARDGAERSLSLRTQLDLKENQLRALQADLSRTRDEMISVKSANTSLRALLSELRAPKPSKDVGVQVSVEGGTLRRNHSMELAVQELARRPSSDTFEREVDFRASTTNLDRGTHHRISSCSTMSEGWPMTQGTWERHSAHWERHSAHWEREQSVASVASSQYSREDTPTHSPHLGKKFKKKKGPLFGKLRKSTGKRGSTPTIIDGVDLSQSSLVQGHSQAPIAFPYQARVSADTQENWRVLDEAQHVPFQHWNGRAIVAWISTSLGMSQYVGAIREHVTTGNAMLALSDSDMEKKLGVTNVLHRRKLRLAIEEHRRPDRVRYPLAGKIDTGWLAEVWVSDIGLPHLSDTMATHLVDGRVLESLTKDDLKKYFKLSKKLEHMSFLAGVELLRMHDFNRQAILDHRASQQSRSSPQNPLYWTNRDVGDWLRDIQLGDYATNLLGSGVHGALLFLERGDKSKFSAEHLAQVLHLPGGKSPARRHLTQQLARLFREDSSESSHRSQCNSVTSFQSNLSGMSPVSPPYPFSGSLYRTGSSPSLNQTGSQPEHRMSVEERIRHSLRESALRSISQRTPSPPSSPRSHNASPRSHNASPRSHNASPHPPCTPSPLTHAKASGTTV